MVKVHRGVVTDELQSDLQVSHREVWERRSNGEIVALQTEINTIDMSLFIMDYDHNAPTVESTCCGYNIAYMVSWLQDFFD